MFDGPAQPLTKLSELFPSPQGDDAHWERLGAAALSINFQSPVPGVPGWDRDSAMETSAEPEHPILTFRIPSFPAVCSQ